MTDNPNIADLHQLLVDLGRSLLQYVGQCWPWTELDAQASRETVEELVARQRTHVARLTDFLLRRGEAVDFGAFPVAYTDLHYVSLDYLLDQLIENQQGLTAGIEATREAAADDLKTAGLLEEILTGERDILEQLQNLAASRTTARSN